MSENSATSRVSRRRFLTVAGTVAAASSLGPGTASALAQPAPTPPISVDYPVTIYLLPNNKLSYKVGGNDANPLTVNANQTVTWKVNNSGKGYHVTILFKDKKTPLVDSSGKPLNAVHGSEQDEGTLKVGGTIGGGAKGHSYKYAVAVFDDANNETYSDDPKIIVGTGLQDAKEELASALDEVKEAEVALASRPKQREQAKSIENQLEHLIADLN
jgi:hypothetical protein